MRPPVGSNEDEQLTAMEGLLRGAAEFEPDEPAPGLLTAGGIALLLADDAARRRRTVRARVAAFAGVFAGTAACSASLVMALNQPAQRVQVPAPAPVQVSQRQPAAKMQETEPRVTWAVTPKRRVVASRSGRRVHPQRSRPELAVPTPPVWTEETVEHQVTGVLAEAWLVQAHEDGSFEVTPALVDLPLSGVAACEPEPDAAPPAPEATASEPDAIQSNLEDNEAR